MKKADVKLGDILGATSEEELKHPFEGKVEKVYDNSALLAITSYDPEDETAVSDLNHKMVVNFKKLKKVKKPAQTKIASTNDVKISKVSPDGNNKEKNDKKSSK
ncbi:DUF2187 domain-containing protein [Lactobacillus sp. PV034]|uniref:DUF2187 domain-containing protein n=1 Tax=Lactobacillus sp. PV034 TaxID=2594495 RepID=UPI00224080E4|nr:DUF2187 domain-containing protein [Lactobacillus sp. PV034]QNQ81285.1 DUF2187 domain-containing protein [Lactobacillus sp. PV034]